MSTLELLQKTIRGLMVEILNVKGGLALVFVNDEYAGSAERDNTLGTWGGYALYADAVQTDEGMWGAIDIVVQAHVSTAVQAVLAR